MKKLSLFSKRKPTGRFAIVDDEDYDRLVGYRWFFKERSVARTAWLGNNKFKTIRLHREVLQVPSGLVVDHINKNVLDNRKCNLRICSQSSNAQNRLRKPRRRPSGRWGAVVKVNYKDKWLGTFDTREEAQQAIDNVKKQLLGFTPQ